jgi:hypothetical protein
MTTHKLDRTGQAPLEFEGERIKECVNRVRGGGHAESRWHELTLYRCDDDTLIAHCIYQTQWVPSEADTHEVIEAPDEEELINELRAYNPCEGFVGRPEHDEVQRRTNGPKNDMVRRSLRQRWEKLISEACEVLGYSEKRRSAGRPALSSEPLVQVGIKIPQDLKVEIDRDRGETGVSEWIRAAIEAYLARDRG